MPQLFDVQHANRNIRFHAFFVSVRSTASPASRSHVPHGNADVVEVVHPVESIAAACAAGQEGFPCNAGNQGR